MVEIKYENGKYIVNATIQTEVSTLDIAKVQEYFSNECQAAFALAIKDMVTENALLHKIMREQKEKSNEND